MPPGLKTAFFQEAVVLQHEPLSRWERRFPANTQDPVPCGHPLMEMVAGCRDIPALPGLLHAVKG
jgi:hypothetical protein